MKEMYEQAVAESEGNFSSKKDQDIVMSEKARLIKERFERGEVVHSGSEDEDDKKNKNREADDLSVFEAGKQFATRKSCNRINNNFWALKRFFLLFKYCPVYC